MVFAGYSRRRPKDSIAHLDFQIQRNGSRIFDRSGYRLLIRRQGLPGRQTAVLDADGHAGWELARALLRPRRIEADSENNVTFKRGGVQRISTAAARKHTFIKRVRQGRV